MNMQHLPAILFAAVTGLWCATALAYEVEGPVDDTGQAAAVKPDPDLPVLLAPVGDPVPYAQSYDDEVEPNNTPATATGLSSGNAVVRGAVFGNGDVDLYAFDAPAGARLYASAMSSFSPASTDTTLVLYASDGTTVIETDLDDGSFGGTASVIAGATLAAGGAYYLEVRGGTATAQVRPYELHVRVHAAAPVAEVEPNDNPAAANALPADGFVSGARNPAQAAEQDWYSFTVAAGETAVLMLDADPERDGTSWNGRLGVALFGDASNQILVVNDANAGAAPANPPGEAMYMTVKNPGTYFAFVDSADPAVGGPTATYQLSVSIRPNADPGASCATYASTAVPATIGPGAATVATSTITVPAIPGARIVDVDVAVDLTHALMADIDATLASPAGGETGLFTDIGASATGGQLLMDVLFDDEAAIPPAFTALRSLQLKPEFNYRLGWFDGEDPAGTWTLTLRDDTENTSGGTLNAWSLRVCTAPPPEPTCAGDRVLRPVFDAAFEEGDAGFTVAGTNPQWARGTPATPATPGQAPFTTCASGSNCWKTNLTGPYAASTVQDLRSPTINLAGIEAPILVSWSQRYQMESASFDLYFVDASAPGGANPQRLFEWRDGTMNHTIGLPAVATAMAAGWGRRFARADAFAGASMELLYGVRTDTTVQLSGVAIDDVRIEGCVTDALFSDGFEPIMR